jgi:hypothetical protein
MCNENELSPFYVTVPEFHEHCERFAFKIKQMVLSEKNFDNIYDAFENGNKALVIMLSRFSGLESDHCCAYYRRCLNLAYDIMYNA